MKDKNLEIEKGLLDKLQKVEEGNEVQLTKSEAKLYGVEVADILPDEDLESDESETNLID